MKFWKLFSGADSFSSAPPAKELVEILMRVFYAVKGTLVLWHISHFINSRSVDAADWLWPVAWLGWFDSPVLALVLLFVAAAALPFASAFFPWNRKIKLAEAMAFFLFLAVYYSFGKIDHSFYGYLWSSLFIALIKRQSQSNGLALQAAGGATLFFYGLAGLWKARNLLGATFYGVFAQALGETFSFHIARGMVENGYDGVLANWALGLAPSVQGLLWCAVIVFELSAFAAIFLPRWWPVWGVGIVLFHFATDLFMDITFEPAQLLAAILLIAFPLSSFSFKKD